MYSCTFWYVPFFMSLLTFCPPLKKINKKILSFLFLGCLPVCDDSLSTRVYQSAPVQTSLPLTFCPLALAIISNNHSRSGSKKKNKRLGTRWDTSMCSFFRHFSSMIQDFFFCSSDMFLFVFLLELTVFFLLIFTLFWRKTPYLLSHSGIIKEMHFSSACTIASGSSYSHSVSDLYSVCFS